MFEDICTSTKSFHCSHEDFRKNYSTEIFLQLNLWDRKTKSSGRWFFQQILLFWNGGQQNELDASFDLDVTELSWKIKRQSLFPRISSNLTSEQLIEKFITGERLLKFLLLPFHKILAIKSSLFMFNIPIKCFPSFRVENFPLAVLKRLWFPFASKLLSLKGRITNAELWCESFLIKSQ